MNRMKSALARFVRLFHLHDWHKKGICRFLDLTRAIWPFKGPYIEICWCGATRLRETGTDE